MSTTTHNILLMGTKSGDDKYRSTHVRYKEFQRGMFRDFLNGNAGYVIKDLNEFRKLFLLLRHTNISVFNANYTVDTLPAFDSKGRSFYRSILPGYCTDNRLPDVTLKTDMKGVLVWLLPQDTDGSYSVSADFIKSTADVLGVAQLSGIKRMECCLFEVGNDGTLLKVPSWWCDGTRVTDISCGNVRKKCLPYYIPTEVVDNNILSKPIINRPASENKAFYAVVPDFDQIGTTYFMNMIECHLKYRKSMKKKISNLMKFILEDIADDTQKSVDDLNDTLMKAQAIIAWLLHPESNNVRLYFKKGGDATFKKLVSIAMLCNIVIPTNASGTGVYMDAEGMIQIETDGPDTSKSYKAIEDCEEAIDAIYKVIKYNMLKPVDSMNFANACHYPYMDNVPSIFWNGNLF